MKIGRGGGGGDRSKGVRAQESATAKRLTNNFAPPKLINPTHTIETLEKKSGRGGEKKKKISVDTNRKKKRKR